VFVLDSGNHRVEKFDANGIFQAQWGTSGTGAGQFGNAEGLTVAGFSGGDVYVADSSNQRVQEFDTFGNFVRMWGVAGSGDGQFSDPYDIAVASSGVLVTDSSNNRFQRFGFGGAFLSKAGSSGSDGAFDQLADTTVDASGNTYVADYNKDRIEKFDAAGKFLMSFGTTGSGNGQLNGPRGVAIDSIGSVIVADSANHRIVEFTSNGTFLRTWGWGVDDGSAAFQVCPGADPCQAGIPGSGDGQFVLPSDVGIHLALIYVVDHGNARIQKFDPTLPPASQFVAKFGTTGATEGKFLGPEQIAFDDFGDLFVTEHDNHRVQELDLVGDFEKMWGWGVASGASTFEICTSFCQAGLSGSGNGQFNAPQGIAVDSTPNIYVADTQNNRVQVFRDTGAFVKKWGTTGTGPGELGLPVGLAFGLPGQVYVAEGGNNKRVQLFGETDVSAPETTIDIGPKSFTKDTTPTFQFSSDDLAASFECRLDLSSEQAFFPCTSPYTPSSPLLQGSHQLTVRAYDTAGNLDHTPAFKNFTVDTTPPDTKISAGPSGPTHDRTPTFKFRSTESGSTFKCAIVGGTYRKCSSPSTQKTLSFGPHMFRVRATDKAGNTDPTPAKRSFKVVR
jgi:tripartite motif-containing protein 71